jgi:hypothetical protein
MLHGTPPADVEKMFLGPILHNFAAISMAPKQKTDRTIYSAKICHNAIGFPKWWNQVEQNKICKENSLQSGRFHQGSSHSSLLC